MRVLLVEDDIALQEAIIDTLELAGCSVQGVPSAENALASPGLYQSKFAGLSFDPHADPLSTLPVTTRQEIENEVVDSRGPSTTCNRTRPSTQTTTRLSTSSCTT